MTVMSHKLTVIGPCFGVPEAKVDYRFGTLPQHFAKRKLNAAFMAGDHEIPDLHSRVVRRDRLMVALSAKHRLTTEPEVEWR